MGYAALEKWYLKRAAVSDQNTSPKLFVTDLDGTALGGEYRTYRRLPDPFCVFLDRLVERGCRWTINSGWKTDLQWQLVLNSVVKSRPAFLMGSAGMQLEQVTQLDPVPVQPYSAQEIGRGLETAGTDFKARRHLIELLDVRATLAIEAGKRIVHARCILGESELSVGETST